MKAKKSLGQNFLVDDKYINSIINAVNVFSNELIIEIGPGRGALTRLLKEKNTNIVAFELDTDLKQVLNQWEDDKTKIVYEDFLKVDINKYIKGYNDLIIIGNLPYYITTPIIEHIIKSKANPREIIIMVQKEVGERFLAQPNSREYGYFTLYLKYYFVMDYVIDVPRGAFNPVPKVDSMVIKLKRREDKVLVDEKKYMDLLKLSFRQKRKQLKNNISGVYDFSKVSEVLRHNGLKETVRAEEVPEEVFVEIANNC